ncbi:hypothetical protein [Marinobacter nanhaiticus]|uniref:hypothetical protein n=1 Tax=Marinobacter nanhaiticus TaxID=1305740 RepID=UPI0003A979EA|nr:hypothetical protein [Marinobacter nanhaiticus]
MEPIRPERDEVRTSSKSAGAGKDKPPGTPRKQEVLRDRGSNGSGATTAILAILLIVAIAAGGWGWYAQGQRIDQMSERLQEADYWARQSKLALARFEGQLSETGETLQEKGSNLSDQIASLDKRAETADSEIRKLWAVANERNKEAISANKAALAYLEETTSNMKNQFKETTDNLRADINALQTASEERAAKVEQLAQAVEGIRPRLEQVEQTAQQMTNTVEQRLDRFGREQDLARQELVARLDSLEDSSGNLQGLRNDLASTRERISQIEGAIDAIDAARAQLNSRLIRLNEEVDGLRAQGG